MIYDETARMSEAWEHYDELLTKKIERLSDLVGIEKEHFIKINPAEFIEKSRFQELRGYEYKNIGKWIQAMKTDDKYLISPLDEDNETAEQIRYKARSGELRKIRASKCETIFVGKDVALDFCIRNHRQSLPLITASALYMGLVFAGELIAIMGYDVANGAVRGSKDGYELVRLAIARDTQVHGGAGKLQKACEEVLLNRGIYKIFSYSNATINNGAVYERLGFIKGKVDGGQPFVITRDNNLVRLVNLNPYSTDEELALRHQLKTHVSGNRIWHKEIGGETLGK